MRVIAISVSRYRSINEAIKVPLGVFTVLTGKNNAGKSNFLRALQIAFSAIQENATANLRIGRDSGYHWKRDFPVSLRDKEKGRRDTTIRITLELTDPEVDIFVERIGVNISPELQIEATIGRTNSSSVSVRKQGPSAKLINDRIKEVCEFITDNINFLYIPAVRTEKDAEQIVARLLQRKVYSILRSDGFADALAQIEGVVSPLVSEIEQDISDTLSTFLPEMTEVKIERGREGELRSRIVQSVTQSIALNINDGVDTSLSYKGDGVKSIVAIALFKHSAPSAGSSFLAIEEPEVHLHAGAIREIKKVITEIAKESQVVISTHSPAFVARDDPRQNIIVDGGSVRSAKNVREIRELMGMRASDNLMHADLAIVVEGPSDYRIVSKIFETHAADLNNAVKAGTLAFESIGGAGKFTYKATTLKREIVPFHAILDRDAAGIAAVNKGVDEGLIEHADYTLLVVPGLNESELEDLIDPSVFAPVFAHFGITLDRRGLIGKDKWSVRAQKRFEAEGKIWSATVKQDLKDRAAAAIVAAAGDVLDPNRAGIAHTFIGTIRGKLAAALT